MPSQTNRGVNPQLKTAAPPASAASGPGSRLRNTVLSSAAWLKTLCPKGSYLRFNFIAILRPTCDWNGFSLSVSKAAGYTSTPGMANEVLPASSAPPRLCISPAGNESQPSPLQRAYTPAAAAVTAGSERLRVGL